MNDDRRPSIPRPTRPELAEGNGQKGSLLSMFLAGGLAVAVCTALLFLSLGTFGSFLVIGGGVFALAALHYVVWGWWLSKLIHEEYEAEGSNSQAALPRNVDQNP